MRYLAEIIVGECPCYARNRCTLPAVSACVVYSPYHFPTIYILQVPRICLLGYVCQGVCGSLSFLCEVFPQGAEHRCLDDASGAHEAQDLVFVQEVDCDVFRGFEMLAVKTAYTCGDKAVA